MAPVPLGNITADHMDGEIVKLQKFSLPLSVNLAGGATLLSDNSNL